MADDPVDKVVPIKPPVSAQPSMGANAGPTPQFDPGMTFAEYGSSGLRAFSGWVREEFLPELIGRSGAQRFREMMQNSPIIGAVMFAINSTMRKVEWRVKPAGEDEAEPSPEARQSAEFVESCMDDMTHTWEDLISENLSMLGYGYAPHEIVYKRRLGREPGPDKDNPGKNLPKSKYDDGLIGWRRIPLRGQDTVLKWFFDRYGDIEGMTQQPWVGPLVDIPIEKMLLFRPNQHKNNPEGISVLRTAYLPYYFVKRMQEQESIMGERLGGVPVLYVPGYIFENAKTDAGAAAALAMYKKIATNVRVDEQMGIVLPSDPWEGAGGQKSNQKMFEFCLVTPQGRMSTAVNFNETITRYNNAMLTSVLADYIAMGHTARGSQNLGETKVDMFYQAVEGYLNSMAAIYNRHALPRLWDLNGMDYETMPELVPDLAQRVDLDVLSMFVLRMAQAGMPLFPNEELQNYILDAGGLPDITDERALQAAGLTDEQLNLEDDKAQQALENMMQPQQPKPAANSNFQKMVLASVARRMIRNAGPKFGVHKHKHGRKRK